uniref:Uncharacterized protein n=1 Tax=Setaria viridis TaxID=4556 RepID=A0A4U6UWQ7_SETVI|nr:hypothetical protein SEVIR_4G183401v2 [Setaria viridis]
MVFCTLKFQCLVCLSYCNSVNEYTILQFCQMLSVNRSHCLLYYCSRLGNLLVIRMCFFSARFWLFVCGAPCVY